MWQKWSVGWMWTYIDVKRSVEELLIADTSFALILATSAPVAFPTLHQDTHPAQKNATKILQLALIDVFDFVTLEKIVHRAKNLANFVVAILGALESVEKIASRAQSRVLGRASILGNVTCPAEHRAIDYLAIFDVLISSIADTGVLRSVARLVPSQNFVRSVAQRTQWLISCYSGRTVS
jgi:hypothetical protein